MDKIEIEKQQPETLSSIINKIVEKIVASKGWTELYQKTKSIEKFAPILIYKMLYKSNGNEEKMKEKIIKRKAKLQKKLKKHNLEQQFNQLMNTIEICYPKIAFRILKKTGGDVNLATQKIQSFSQMGSHKQEIMQMFKINYPNYETIIEDLLLNGYIFPIPFFLRLMYKFQGDINRIKEYLGKFGQKGGKKAFKHLFKGGCMMKQFQYRCGSKKSRSRSRSRSKSSKSSSSSSDDSDIDNNKIQEYSKANTYLIENGFKDAKENLKILKKYKCDKEAALNYLIKSVLKKSSKSEKKKSKKQKPHRKNKKSSSSSRSSSRSYSKSSSSDSKNKSKDRSKSKSKSQSRHKKYHKHHRHQHPPHDKNEFHHSHPHHRPFFMHTPPYMNQDNNFMPPPPPPHSQPFGRFEQYGQVYQDCMNFVNNFRNNHSQQQQRGQNYQHPQDYPTFNNDNRQNMHYPRNSCFSNQNENNPFYQKEQTEQTREEQKKKEQQKQQSKEQQSNDTSSSDVEILIEDTNKKLNISEKTKKE